MKKIPQFVKFTVSSILSAAVDFLLFYLIKKAIETGTNQTSAIITATIAARLCSTIINFTINKLWSFESKKSAGREIILFSILFISKMGASAILVAVFAFIKIPTVVLKMIVDTMLFFVSFTIQKQFIFK